MAVRIRFRRFYECDTESDRSLDFGADSLLYCIDTDKYYKIYNGAYIEVLPEDVVFTSPIPISKLDISGVPDGTKFLRDDGSWAPPQGLGLGTVTSVGVSVPTGFTVSNTPVTSIGTIAITFDTGYALPTTASQTNWDTAYGWGNHALAGYLTSLNTLTATSQTFATGTTGTDFNIVSATSTHTFNIPSASATARGLVTTGTQTFAGAKTFNSSVTASSFYLSSMTGGNGALYYNTSEARLTLANYNGGGKIMLEVGGGSYTASFNEDLSIRFFGYTSNGFLKTSSSNGTLIVDTTSYTPTTRTLTINGTAYDLTADRIWTISTGHTIYDSAGTAMTQRPDLKFVRLNVTDVASQTVVTRPADTFIGSTAPTDPVEGDEWTSSETWKTYKWYINPSDSLGKWVEVLLTSGVTSGDYVTGSTSGSGGPAGSANFIPKWNALRNLTDSPIYVGAGGAVSMQTELDVITTNSRFTVTNAFPISERNSTSTNSLYTTLRLYSRLTTGTHAVGFGNLLSFGSNIADLGYIATVVTDATVGSPKSDMIFAVTNSAVTPVEKFRLKSDGQLKLTAYTAADSFDDTTLVGYLGFDAQGNILTSSGSGGGGGGSGITGVGSINRLAKFTTGATVIGNSIIRDNGYDVALGTSNGTGNTTAGTLNLEGLNFYINGRGKMHIGNNAYRSDAGLIYSYTGEAATYVINASGTHTWNSYPSGTAGNSIIETATTTLMSLSTAGRLRLHQYTSAGAQSGSVIGYLGFSSTGEVLTTGLSPSGIGGTTGVSDNILIRSDGTGGGTIQGSNVLIDDESNITLGGGGTFQTVKTISVTGVPGTVNLRILTKGNTSSTELAVDSFVNNAILYPATVYVYSSLYNGANGFGAGIQFKTHTTIGNMITMGQIAAVYTNASEPVSSELRFYNNNTSNTPTETLRIYSTGQLKLSSYTSATSFNVGGVAGYLGFDSSGNILTTTGSGISGTGNTNKLAKWSSPSVITDSNIIDDGTTIQFQSAVQLTQGQLKFPAVQIASADVNTLDDYEEGTWTPTYVTSATQFTSVTYDTSTAGTYTKIGNKVFISGILKTDAVSKGSASGNIRIGGLPFSSPTTTANTCMIHITYAFAFLSEVPRSGKSYSSIGGNVTTIDLYRERPTQTDDDVAITVADIGTSANNNEIWFNGFYTI